jgi:hypothetical protein
MVNVQAWMKLSGPLLILTGQYQEREIGSTELFHQTFGGGDTGNRSAVEFDRWQVKAMLKNFSSLSHSDEWPPWPMKTVRPLVLCAREGGAAGFAAIDAGFNSSIFGDLPIA